MARRTSTPRAMRDALDRRAKWCSASDPAGSASQAPGSGALTRGPRVPARARLGQIDFNAVRPLELARPRPSGATLWGYGGLRVARGSHANSRRALDLGARLRRQRRRCRPGGLSFLAPDSRLPDWPSAGTMFIAAATSRPARKRRPRRAPSAAWSSTSVNGQAALTQLDIHRSLCVPVGTRSACSPRTGPHGSRASAQAHPLMQSTRPESSSAERSARRSAPRSSTVVGAG